MSDIDLLREVLCSFDDATLARRLNDEKHPDKSLRINEATRRFLRALDSVRFRVIQSVNERKPEVAPVSPHNDLSIGYRAGQEDSIAWRLLSELVEALGGTEGTNESRRRLGTAEYNARKALEARGR